MLTKRWRRSSLELLDLTGAVVPIIYVCEALHVLLGIHGFRLLCTFSYNIDFVCEQYVSMVIFFDQCLTTAM